MLFCVCGQFQMVDDNDLAWKRKYPSVAGCGSYSVYSREVIKAHATILGSFSISPLQTPNKQRPEKGFLGDVYPSEYTLAGLDAGIGSRVGIFVISLDISENSASICRLEQAQQQRIDKTLISFWLNISSFGSSHHK